LFSLSYRPFIRLDSISTAIPDSVQRSFQVVIDITYMVQRPISIFNEMQPGTLKEYQRKFLGQLATKRPVGWILDRARKTSTKSKEIH